MNTNPTYKKRWLSPSSINTYLRCPNKWYQQYVLKKKVKLNIHLLRGGIVHKALERFFREGLSNQTHYDTLRAGILQLFHDEWDAKSKQLSTLNLEESDLAFYENDSQKMILNFLHDWLKTGATHDHNSELEASIFNKKWMLCGRIDRIINNKSPPLVIDYKTCKSIDPNNKDYKRQMGIYQILYEEKHGIKPTTAIHYLKFQDGLREIKVTDHDIVDLKRTILEIHDKTRSTDPADYPCTCGGWCNKEFNK